MALLRCIKPDCSERVESNKLACSDNWEGFPKEIRDVLFEAWLGNDWYFLKGIAGELKDEDTRNRPRHTG